MSALPLAGQEITPATQQGMAELAQRLRTEIGPVQPEPGKGEGVILRALPGGAVLKKHDGRLFVIPPRQGAATYGQ